MSGIQDAGVFGLLAVLASGALALLTVLAYFLARSRRAFGLLLVFAITPLVLSGLGASLGQRRAMRVIASTPGSAHPAEVQRGREQVRAALWLGAGLSFGLATLAAIGLLAKRGDEPLL